MSLRNNELADKEAVLTQNHDLLQAIASNIYNDYIHSGDKITDLNELKPIFERHIKKEQDILLISTAFIANLMNIIVCNVRQFDLRVATTKEAIEEAVGFMQAAINKKNRKLTPEELKTLNAKKTAIAKVFDKYICWYKFSWFGHHHDARARAVKAKVMNCRNVEEIAEVLQSQQVILGQKAFEKVSCNWSSHWNQKSMLKNIPRNNETSGYARVLVEAISELPADKAQGYYTSI